MEHRLRLPIKLEKLLDIVTADPTRKIIVVSAPGKRFGEDEKVTDLLIHLAEKALNGEDTEQELKEVVDRYRSDCCRPWPFDGQSYHVIENDLRERLSTDNNDDSLFMD